MTSNKTDAAGALNQYALSRDLGSRMTPVNEPRFGNFGLLEATAEGLRAKVSVGPANQAAEFTYAEDRVVVRAFEEVRDGAPPDAILWNSVLARAFYQSCRELGLAAPDAFLGRRLLNVRKNKKRYERHGIRITPSTATEPQGSALPQFAHVIEFALVRLRFRYGASIDDILLDSTLGNQLEGMALEIAPRLSPQDVRLGALSIRKSRAPDRKGLAEFTGLSATAIEDALSASVRLSNAANADVPDEPGLIVLSEGNRHLYIARNPNLRPTVREFQSGESFTIMANSFWRPRLDEISFRLVVGKHFQGVGMAKWELRLIYDLEPVFNWPMHKDAASFPCPNSR